MENSIRQLQPLRRHFALNSAAFLICHRRHDFQTMRGVTNEFRRLGLIDYNRGGFVTVHKRLAKVLGDR
jgi:hypothetical protein